MRLVSVLPIAVVKNKAQQCCLEWEFNSIFTVFCFFKRIPFLSTLTITNYSCTRETNVYVSFSCFGNEKLCYNSLCHIAKIILFLSTFVNLRNCRQLVQCDIELILNSLLYNIVVQSILRKLIVPKLIKKFPAFIEPRVYNRVPKIPAS